MDIGILFAMPVRATKPARLQRSKDFSILFYHTCAPLALNPLTYQLFNFSRSFHNC